MGKTTLTNRLNLPDTIVKAVEHDAHVMRGDISVTQLIDAPQIRVLRRFVDKVEDVTDRMYMMWGSAIHNVLERSTPSGKASEAFATVINLFKDNAVGENAEQYARVVDYLKAEKEKMIDRSTERYLIEQTFTVELNGWVLCGTVDLYDKVRCVIQDYKICSVYKWVAPESRKQWIRQLNVYAYILKKNGFEVKGIEIIPFFRDYQKMTAIYKAQKGQDYPKGQIEVIDIPIFEDAIVEPWIMGMIQDHQAAEAGNVRPCTGEERWADATIYSVKKVDGSRAVKNGKFETYAEAQNFIDLYSYKFPEPIEIDVREGVSRRCEEYCPVFSACPQAKQIKLVKKYGADIARMDAEKQFNINN